MTNPDMIYFLIFLIATQGEYPLREFFSLRKTIYFQPQHTNDIYKHVTY